MAGDLVLARIEAGRNALAEARTATEVKSVMDAAQAAANFAKRQKMSAETIRYAEWLRLDAERKLGEILAAMPKNQGAKGSTVTGTKREPVKDDTPTLADLGIDKKTSSRAQQLATLPAEKVEQIKTGEIKLTQALREQRRETLGDRVAALPDGKHRVIYADPPWKYGDERAGLDGYSDSAAEAQYPTMPTKDICALDVRSLAADDAVLFMWATFPLLPDALDVVSAWGFKYKTAFVWNKCRPNMGNYHNASAELLIVATRGSCTPEIDARAEQVQSFKREGRHSEKPEHFRNLIDSLYPTGPRIELFRRGNAPGGWTVWGNEAAA